MLLLYRRQMSREDADMGTLKGFPCPPAMVRRRRGRARKCAGWAGWAVRPEGRRAPHTTSILRPCGAWGFALCAAFLFVGWAGACGKTSQGAGKRADGSFAGAGGSEGDAAMGTGGATGTGGGTGGAGVACSDDAGLGFAAVARQCTQDSDCTIHVEQQCCGADRALGIATAQASTYSACFALAPGACSGLGCAKFIGYQTDTGKTTPFLGTDIQPIDLVSVRCVANLCTTDVLTPADAGQDAPPVVDAATDAGQDAPSTADSALDSGGKSCGKTTCHSGQACVLSGGGPVPRCEPATDAGCSFGLVYADVCYSQLYGQVSPGCADPAPAPGCVDLPDACSDLCGCVCPLAPGGGCIVTPQYVLCSYP
jgi:hypothetical protein